MRTPWGRSDTVDRPCDGVYAVTTPSHGGFLVDKAWAAANLTAAAQAEGESFGEFLAFEEDCGWAFLVFEHPELEIAIHAPDMACRNIQQARQIVHDYGWAYSYKLGLPFNMERCREYADAAYITDARRAELRAILADVA